MAGLKKTLGKGIAAATLVTAVVAFAHLLKKNKKARLLKTAAEDAKAHVLAHARKLGGVSKKSYAKIVDAVLAEYKNMKMLTKRELADLSDELKEGWNEAADRLRARKNR